MCLPPGWRSYCVVWVSRSTCADLVGGRPCRYTHRAQVRRGIDGLSSIVQQALGHSPCAGSAFVFHNCQGNRMKLLVWDTLWGTSGNGVWLCQRRLHRGKFVWPLVSEHCVSITHAEWEWLIAGVDWQRLSAKPVPDWQV